MMKRETSGRKSAHALLRMIQTFGRDESLAAGPRNSPRISRITDMKLLAVSALLFFLAAPSVQAPSLTIVTEPNAVVWIDEIRRGTTDASGKLVLMKVPLTRHSVRVRASGFKETTAVLLPGRRSLSIKLLPTTDEAELLFQQAETAREQAREDSSREKAADLYRQTLKLRPAFPAAHVGLARLLLDLNNFKEAHAEIDAARR